MKEKSLKYGFKIFNKETALLLATGYIVLVAAKKKTGKATQIPQDIVNKLAPFAK